MKVSKFVKPYILFTKIQYWLAIAFTICDFTSKLFCKMIVSMKITNHFSFKFRKKSTKNWQCAVLTCKLNEGGEEKKDSWKRSSNLHMQTGVKNFPIRLSLFLLLFLWSKITQDDSKLTVWCMRVFFCHFLEV